MFPGVLLIMAYVGQIVLFMFILVPISGTQEKQFPTKSAVSQKMNTSKHQSWSIASCVRTATIRSGSSVFNASLFQIILAWTDKYCPHRWVCWSSETEDRTDGSIVKNRSLKLMHSTCENGTCNCRSGSRNSSGWPSCSLPNATKQLALANLCRTSVDTNATGKVIFPKYGCASWSARENNSLLHNISQLPEGPSCIATTCKVRFVSLRISEEIKSWVYTSFCLFVRNCITSLYNGP